MSRITTLKKLWKQFKFYIIVAVTIAILIFVTWNDSANEKLTNFFIVQHNKYKRFRDATDDETFECIEKIEKKRDDIVKRINKDFRLHRDKLRKEKKDKIKRQLNELEGNEQDLENWYNSFLNRNTII